MIAIAIYGISLSMRLDAVQQRVGAYVTKAIQQLSELTISVGSVKVQHMNKVVLKELYLTDERGDTAVSIPKITAHLSPLHMLKGDVRINTLMIGNPTVKLYRTSKEAPLNIDFLLEKLAGDSTKKKSKLPDIRVNQIQLYDGRVSYDVEDVPTEGNEFSPHHIEVRNILCNLSLKKLNNDTLSLYIRNISGEEKRGLKIEKLQARVNANPGSLTVEKFRFAMPESELRANKIAIKSKKKGTFEIDGELYGNALSPSDFCTLLPSLASDLPLISMRIKARGNNNKLTTNIALATDDKSFSLKANGTATNCLKKEKRTIALNISESDIQNEFITHVEKIIGDSTGKFDIVKRLGDISLKGRTTFSKRDSEANFDIVTSNGAIAGELLIDKEQRYSATLHTTAVNIGEILLLKEAGLCNIEFEANGKFEEKSPVGTFKANISDFEYNNYTHSPIKITGEHTKKTVSTTATFTDRNACGEISLNAGEKEDFREFRLKARIDSLRPYEIKMSDEGEGTLTAMIEGDYKIDNTGKSQLDARAYNITYNSPKEEQSIRTFHITDNNLSDTRLLLISSDFMDMNIAGHFSYKGLANTFKNILNRHLPALASKTHHTKANNEYSFKIDIKETKVLSNLLGLPITINERSGIVGSCDDNRSLFYAHATLQNCDIFKQKYRSIDATTVATDEKITFNAKVARPRIAGKKVMYDNVENDMTVNLACNAQNNNINNTITWEQQISPTNSGTFELDIALKNGYNNALTFDAYIKENKLIYNDTPWKIYPCHITGDGESYTIDKFRLHSDNQWIKIDGSIGKKEEDKMVLNVKDISIEDIQNLVNFHSIDFGGKATGDITLSRILNSPQFSSELNVKNFSFEKGYMGELKVKGTWDEESKAIRLLGDIYDKENAHTIVDGFISPANDTINLLINADRTRVEFLNNMLDGILSEVEGDATGNISVVGALRRPNLIGEAIVKGSLKLNVTNTKYKMLGATMKFTHNKMSFNNFAIADYHGNRGTINGSIDHEYLKKFTCSLNIEANNLLAYHTEGFGAEPFYGTAFVSGTANLTTDSRGIFMHANVRGNSGSSFVYDAGSIGSVTSNNFITFTDKSKQRLHYVEIEEKAKNMNSLLSRLNLEFILDVTPDMQLRVFTNVKTGDYIDIYGTGPITAIYDEKEGFSMKGHLNLDRGTYKFTMQDIFPKEFDIIKGSTLTFDGDPFEAELNLKTRYLVPSASLSDLDPDGRRHKSVKVNCLMNITGKLEAPHLAFDIELPDANEEQRELLASAVNTPEQKNMQFIYLMGIGKFYTYDYNRSSNTTTESSTAMESLISNTISGQLNNMLSQIIDNRNWNISGNFSSSERGWNSMEVEGILEGRLLDNRLLINGNFGYRENPMANTNFVGDFEVQWLLDKNGNISLKAYNKTNDRYFSESTLTTQGAGIILRHDFNKWLWWLKKREKKEEE